MTHKVRSDKTQIKVKAGKIHTAKGKKKFSKRMARKK